MKHQLREGDLVRYFDRTYRVDGVEGKRVRCDGGQTVWSLGWVGRCLGIGTMELVRPPIRHPVLR